MLSDLFDPVEIEPNTTVGDVLEHVYAEPSVASFMKDALLFDEDEFRELQRSEPADVKLLVVDATEGVAVGDRLATTNVVTIARWATYFDDQHGDAGLVLRIGVSGCDGRYVCREGIHYQPDASRNVCEYELRIQNRSAVYVWLLEPVGNAELESPPLQLVELLTVLADSMRATKVNRQYQYEIDSRDEAIERIQDVFRDEAERWTSIDRSDEVQDDEGKP